MNNKKQKYFNLNDYVNSINLSDELLEHLEKTNNSLSKYLQMLSEYNDNAMVYLWIDSFLKDFSYSLLAESKKKIRPLSDSDFFFDNFKLNFSKLHEINSFVSTSNEQENEFHKVGEIETLIFDEVNHNDLIKFMKDFVKIYKVSDHKIINNDPFLKSALVQALLIKIQPYLNANKRTARMLSNMKFTEEINKKIGTKLTISPLYISKYIYYNYLNYLTKLGDISFDLNKDPSLSMNKYFDFILNMYDEELFSAIKKLETYDQTLKNIPTYDDYISKKAKKMKLQRIRDIK